MRNSIVAVAQRLDVGMSWLAKALDIELQDIAPTKCLTDAAIRYLQYCKEPFQRDAVEYPGKNNIFETEPRNQRPKVKQYIQATMYAKQIKICREPHLTPIVIRTKAVQCLDKEGQWVDREMLMCLHDGLVYYFQEIRVSIYGTTLNHVWAILVNSEPTVLL